jgi:hypothetical protein
MCALDHKSPILEFLYECVFKKNVRENRILSEQGTTKMLIEFQFPPTSVSRDCLLLAEVPQCYGVC